mmetsp:Transcript_11025/g.33041  ORF Transcript_11025/g.33041 Transcript_11025/m.33041 type:complete len:225 (-) Transcript_11025:7023-7697(-)
MREELLQLRPMLFVPTPRRRRDAPEVAECHDVASPDRSMCASADREATSWYSSAKASRPAATASSSGSPRSDSSPFSFVTLGGGGIMTCLTTSTKPRNSREDRVAEISGAWMRRSCPLVPLVLACRSCRLNGVNTILMWSEDGMSSPCEWSSHGVAPCTGFDMYAWTSRTARVVTRCLLGMSTPITCAVSAASRKRAPELSTAATCSEVTWMRKRTVGWEASSD